MRRIVAFIVLGLALLAMLNLVNRASEGRQATARVMAAAFARTPGSEAVAFGGKELDLEAMCLDGQRFSQTADLFEIAAIGRAILERPDPPRLWFVQLAPSTQSVSNGGRASETGAQRRETYRLLHGVGDWRLIDGDWRQAVLAETAPLGPEAWAGQLRALGLLPGEAGPPPDPDAVGFVDEAASARRARRDVMLRRERVDRTAYYDPGVGSRSMRALRGLNRGIQAHGGVLVLHLPPVTPAVRREMLRLMPDAVGELQEGLRVLEREGAVVEDRWADADFWGRPGLSVDGVHLTRTGAALYSQQLGAGLDVIQPEACAYFARPNP